jgi:hypothetical protein
VTAPAARYLIELAACRPSPYLRLPYVGQTADGRIFWTANHEEAKAFRDASEAQAFADANVAGNVRIIWDRQWATSSR